MYFDYVACAHALSAWGVGIGLSHHPVHFLPARRSLSACGRMGVVGCVGSVARARLSGTRAVQRFTLVLCYGTGASRPCWGVVILLSSASPAHVRHGQLCRGNRAAAGCRLAKVLDLWLLFGWRPPRPQQLPPQGVRGALRRIINRYMCRLVGAGSYIH